MSSIAIRVQTAGALYLVVTPPTVKLRNPETGEIAKHRDSGHALYTVSLAETFDGRAQVIKVTVPENGLPTGLSVGQVVMPRNLTATPWARMFNPDQLSEGVVYRADALDTSTTTDGKRAASATAAVKNAATADGTGAAK